MAEDDWPEHEYAEHLESERANYAWTMQHYGGMSAQEAQQAALESYPYEPPDAPYRGLHFNKQAWYWAIDRIAHTQGKDRDDFPGLPPEYPGYIAPGSVEIDPAELEALRRKLHGE
jgi:hypothetical protein